MDIEERFKEAISTRNSGNLELAAKMLDDITKEYPNHPKIGGIYTVLGNVYDDLDLLSMALNCFIKATKLNPSSELSSLGLYLIYTKLEEYEDAIRELKRYLDKYPAKNYKTTLEELLNDMEVGYALSYKETIIDLAKKHNVSLPLN